MFDRCWHCLRIIWPWQGVVADMRTTAKCVHWICRQRARRQAQFTMEGGE